MTNAFGTEPYDFRSVDGATQYFSFTIYDIVGDYNPEKKSANVPALTTLLSGEPYADLDALPQRIEPFRFGAILEAASELSAQNTINTLLNTHAGRRGLFRQIDASGTITGVEAFLSSVRVTSKGVAWRAIEFGITPIGTEFS